MSTLFVLLWLVANIVMIIYIAKLIGEKKKGFDTSNSKKIALISFGCAFLFLILTGVTGSKEKENNIAETTKEEVKEEIKEEVKEEVKEEKEEKEEPKEEAATEDKKALQEAFAKSLGDTKPIFYKTVNHDVTDNWRMLVCYTNKSIDKDLAVEYCKAYYESDEEVHFIVNLYLKTTTVLNKYGNMLIVTCKEYQDKEEVSAKTLGGGMELDTFIVDVESGELMDTEIEEDQE